MTAIARYLTSRYLFHLLLVLIALAALSLAFDLMEKGDQVLYAANGGVSALARYAGLRAPDIVAQMLPMACLLGGMVTMALLIRHAELVALWSSGVSSLGVARALIPVAVVLGAAQFVLDDLAVPKTADALRAWGVADQRGSVFAEDSEAVWLMSGNDIVRVPREAGRAGRLFGITIFERDEDGALLRQIDAERAEPAADGWTLYSVQILTASHAAVETLHGMSWPGRIDIGHLPLLAKKYRELSIGDMQVLIGNHGFGQQPPYLAKTWLCHRLTILVTPALMIGLVASLASWHSRTGGFGPMFLLSLGIGFGFLALDRMSLAMSESGLLPPLAGALAVKAALIGLIGVLFLRNER
ncbi:MAG: LptF/LptG family permease [Defluviicoccus sp.]